MITSKVLFLTFQPSSGNFNNEGFMKDYQAVDLSKAYNVTADIYKNETEPPVGNQVFHGLPFKIGSGLPDTKTFIGFGSEIKCSFDPITININSPAVNVIFAHSVMKSKILEGGLVGVPVATYKFLRDDGTEETAVIRERFEIGYAPRMPWGQYPFLCVPDQKPSLWDRKAGDWGSAGRRQTEAEQGWPKGYFLWSWHNSKNAANISSITIIPEQTPFVIAGITLGQLQEDPFCRWAARDVKIDFLEQSNNADLDVEVDRGYSTYSYPLPDQNKEKFLNDSHRGWGQSNPVNPQSIHVGIAGTPSATITVRKDGKTIGTTNWGQLEEKETIKTPKVRFEVIDTGRNWVHTKVVDEKTGAPLPCRIHFRSSKGVPYAPHGHHAHVNSNLESWHTDVGGDVRLGNMSYAYIDGNCQGWLPRGEVHVDVARGYEYEPIRESINIEPGQRELTLKLRRWINMNEERYFSGDTHVHFLSTQGAHLEAQGEGLNVVNLLLSQWGSLFTNTEEFTGAENVAPGGESIVYATQENRQHFLGHLTLLGLKKPVMPWCSDGPSEAELGGNLETTLSYWADECHRQGGTVIIPHIPNPNCEPAALIATDRADAVEFLIHSEYNHLDYYRYLNCGYKLPLVGGTDKMSSDVPVGIYRTYAYIPPDQEFNYNNWCKALKTGNTFLSAGPILHFTVNGQAIGDTIQLSGNGGTVHVEATAASTLPIHTLEIVQQGKVVASTQDKTGRQYLSIKTEIKVDGHSWLAARCAGPNYTSIKHHDGWGRGIMAHTSPVYIACGGPYWLFDLENAQYMLSLIEGGLAYIKNRSWKHKAGTVTHHHHAEDHDKFLEEPYLQAQKAIHRRMHELNIPH